MTQDEALAILKTGASVFLTGEPGAGKTHTVNAYVDYLRERELDPAITASTGIAATHIGGMTIHSWSGIGIRPKLTAAVLEEIAANEYVAKRIRIAKILIIDEVSMLAPETLGMVDAVCREIKRDNLPFGGLQVLLVGDFFQLPPIVRTDTFQTKQTELLAEKQARFAYDAPAWARLNPVVCYLTEQHRQDDAVFLELLSAIRSNSFAPEHLQKIETRTINQKNAPTNAPKLYSHNIDVDRVNDQTLATLPGSTKTYTMKGHGAKGKVESLKKGCLSPETLVLKIGASVMFTKNNPRGGFVNGTLGTVIAFGQFSGNPIVRTRGGAELEVEPMDWTVEEGGVVRATIEQLPLRLAWAITVHKSQGMSLDEAVVDLSRVFEYGQGYVALSRVRRLSGVHLLGSNDMAFMVHPEVLLKDLDFKASSVANAAAFGAIAQEELAKMHHDFITAAGGKNKVVTHDTDQHEQLRAKSGMPKKKALNYEAIREKFPNAYRPWKAEDDAKLKELFENEVSPKEMIATLGRKSGGIRSRLVKLGLVEVESD